MKSIFHGTLILTMSSILARIMGLVFKIMLSRVIGAEGLGLFQMVLPLYSIAGVFASMGIPGAVAQKISRYRFIDKIAYEEGLKAYALKTAIICSITVSCSIFFFLPYFVHFFPDERIFIPLRIIPLALLFAAPAAVYKGYFEGLQNMYPTAYSMMGEQITRVILGYTGVIIFLPYGLKYAISGLTAGIIIGELIGLIIIIVILKQSQYLQLNKLYQKSWLPYKEKKELMSLALPLLFIRLSGSLSHAIESLLIPFRLQTAGFSSSFATALYGKLVGMAFPLLFLPTVLIIPFTVNLLPQIAKAASRKDYNNLKQSIFVASMLTMILGILTTLFLYFFSETLTRLLFTSPETAPVVKVISISAPFAYLQFVSATIIHGLGFPAKALKHDLIGTSVTLILLYLLAADAAIGIFAAGPAYTSGFALTTWLNYQFINKWYRKKNPIPS